VDAQLNPRAVQLSVVMPCLNEAEQIGETLAGLQQARNRGTEIVVVDGGSHDGTVSLAAAGADVVVSAGRGRARQMNAGATRATGDVLLFLHADSRPPADFDRMVVAALAASARRWGRFDVSIGGAHRLLPVIAAAVNLRSRLTGIATGDQAIFVTRALFEASGGFPDIPLMEDVAFSASLRQLDRPLCLRHRVFTSGRRWEKHGVLRTILLMWRLRLAYALGASPHDLARRYAPHKS
jgi:rSAM/selenodomain-associated transferase 2